MNQAICPLCHASREKVIWQNTQLRIINAQDPLFPNYTRLIWKDHIAEMSDLSPEHRQMIGQVLHLIECTQRRILKADKINLAAFGNMVPHLHWHIIPRYHIDPKFPQSVFQEHLTQAIDSNYLHTQKALQAAYEQALFQELNHYELNRQSATC